MVYWDQRGAGRTFARNGVEGSGRLTIECMIADALEVAEYVSRHLGKKKIVLLGHSWGTVLGLNMIIDRKSVV